MVLTRMSAAMWRSEPGPLRLRRINTGAGALRIDPKYGGIVIAEVQANLGAHGLPLNLHRTNASIRTQASSSSLGQASTKVTTRCDLQMAFVVRVSTTRL